MNTRLEDGSWEAFATERLPGELDNAIKGAYYRWMHTQGKSGPDELEKGVRPMSFPMARMMCGRNTASQYMVAERHTLRAVLHREEVE